MRPLKAKELAAPGDEPRQECLVDCRLSQLGLVN